MAPSCALDETGRRAQYARYRQLGSGAHAVERAAGRLVVDLAEDVDAALVEQTLAVERECCPFFELTWKPRAHRLSVSVQRTEHAAAINAIAFALGLGEPAQHTPSS